MPDQAGASNDFTLVARLLSDGFNRIDNSLAELRRSLDGKADNTRVAALEESLSGFKKEVDGRFRPLEETSTEGRALGRFGLWLVGTIGVAVFLACITILSALISGRHL